MNTEKIELDNMVEQFLVCIQEDIENIEQNLLMLNQLRSAVIKRDEKRLAVLLNSIGEQSGAHEYRQSKRHRIRVLLAEATGCQTENITLSKLTSFVNRDTAARLNECRRRLRDSALQMKKEYASTAMMLSECSRINSRLLNAIFQNKSNDVITYDSNGSAGKPSGSAFVNLKL